MDFGLSEEQAMLQETVRGFAEKECPTTRLRELFDEGLGHDPALWGALAEMGVAGLIVPEEHGGAGMEVLDLALVAEVLGEFAIPTPFLGHVLATRGVILTGSPAQQAKILPALAAGEQIATVALQEGDASWTPESWTAELRGGHLHGEKTIVSHAALADGFLVGLSGGDLAWVDARADGVITEDLGGIDRTRPISRVRFEGAPAELLAGGAGDAWALVDTAAVLLAADAFGAAAKLIDIDVAYALQREQFGQPIGQFQAIKHTIAQLGTDIEPARALFWYAAHCQDAIPAEAAHAASVAKAHITDRAMNTARESVELHGGYGFTWECEVQMWFKRIMLDRSLLGTPDQWRERTAMLGEY
jgi:alkylation response protein AidB-like acyl-CoA dehydrogenase